jgi:hypothetical protein
MINYCINPDKDCRKKIDFDGNENLESRGCRRCDMGIKDCNCKPYEQNLEIFLLYVDISIA